ALAEHERGRDLPVRPAGGDEEQHLQLALGEAVGAARRGAAERADPGEVRPRSQAGVGGARRLELEPGGLLVAESTAGERDELPDPGDLVGRLEPPPDLAG